MKKNSTNKTTKDPSFQVINPLTVFENGIPQPEPFQNLIQSYSVHAWVYICTSIIASNFAGIEFLPYIEKSKGEWVLDESHEFIKLLQTPNPYMSGYSLREFHAASVVLTGNSYWYAETFGTNKIHELWPLLPDRVKPVSSKDKLRKRVLRKLALDFGISREIAFKPKKALQYGSGVSNKISKFF